MVKTMQGGKRENSGRKPTLNKKLPVTLYIESDTIKKVGSTELRQKLYNHLKKMK